MEGILSRVINPNSVGKERTQLVKSVALSIRELTQQSETGQEARDLAAYIALALRRVSATVEQSVVAWEKRDYWVKADRFRMDWAWSGRYSGEMEQAIVTEDWPVVAMTAAAISSKISNVKVSARHRMGRPWVGAHKELMEQTELQN
jgi:hypothetical protein